MVEGTVSYSRNPNHPSYADETNGFYNDPTDTYGYFHQYESANNDQGNVTQSDLRDANNQALAVVLGRDRRGRPSLTSPTSAQINRANSSIGDGMKFRGRGFKQLTGLYNYTSYWTYRGWLHSADYDATWWDRAGRRVPQIVSPQDLSTEPYNCIDSGGGFVAKNGILRRADGGVRRSDADAVSTIINRYDAPSFPVRFNSTVAVYRILGDE